MSRDLREALKDQYTLENGVTRPLYLGLRVLREGDLLYKGCKAISKASALETLERPGFFSAIRSEAVTDTVPFVEEPFTGGRQLLTLVVAKDIRLANIIFEPLLDSPILAKTPVADRIPLLVGHLSTVLGASIDGLWDKEGDDVFITHPEIALRVHTVDELSPIPPRRQSLQEQKR